MSKQIDKTIRALKSASKSMSYIDVKVIDDIYCDGGYSIAIIQDKITDIIFDLENEYKKIHRIGSHMED